MNAPTPYQGKEKYIFISYSHRDTAKVFPIIFALMDEGYRVWYDQGIDPGTEWDENIAMHINDCGYFIAFMSSNYLGSSNCKDELNYARDLEKDRLIVYLEDVKLPAGMAMRVNRLQSIFKHTYVNEKDFYDKLFAANNINVCLAEKKPARKKRKSPHPHRSSLRSLPFQEELTVPAQDTCLTFLRQIQATASPDTGPEDSIPIPVRARIPELLPDSIPIPDRARIPELLPDLILIPALPRIPRKALTTSTK
ncbi:MAG: toll/interleukin-1 receptor domain-containing protein [Ruminococcaceae bacterium]|nr:toll/interleukin-1 receptor domain-containing protein [Oscillospiraceae bacterium]